MTELKGNTIPKTNRNSKTFWL